MIEVFTFTYNEVAMLPWFVRHYGFASKITVFDNQSTDGTQELARELGCFVVERDTGGQIDDEDLQRVKNSCWKGSTADWVIVADIDEFLYHPCLLETLSELRSQGVTLPNISGYEMCGYEGLPQDDSRQLSEHLKFGAPSEMYSKQVIFDPRLEEIGYRVGSHSCVPSGNIVRGGSLNLLHYNFLGIGYIHDRWSSYRPRVQADAATRGLKTYAWTPQELAGAWRDIRRRAVQVVA